MGCLRREYHIESAYDIPVPIFLNLRFSGITADHKTGVMVQVDADISGTRGAQLAKGHWMSAAGRWQVGNMIALVSNESGVVKTRTGVVATGESTALKV